MILKTYFIFLISLFTIKAVAAELPEKINHLAIVIASSKGIGKSSFGHAYLRISSDEYWNDNDTLVEYLANNNGEPISELKGLGLTPQPYHFMIHFSSYSSVKYEMNILENRDLINYPLNLDTEQLKKIRDSLQEQFYNINNEKYKFITKNCSTQVSSLLDSVLKSENGGLSANIPALLHSRYKSWIDESNITVDLAATKKRKNLIVSTFKELFLDLHHPIYQNIIAQLVSDLYSDRVFAIVKLIKINNYLNLTAQQKKQIFIFLNRYALLETSSNSKAILKIVNQRNFQQLESKIVLVPLFAASNEYPIDAIEDLVLSKKNTIYEKDNHLFVNFQYRSNNAISESQSISKLYKFDLTSFGVKILNGHIYYQGHEIGQSFKTKKFVSSKIENSQFILQAEIIKGETSNYLLPYIIIDFSDENSPGFINSDLKISNDDIIPFPNFSYHGIGNCGSLVKTQKQLLEQTRFLSELKPLDHEKNIELFKKITEGYFVFVPGFNSIYDWLEFIGKDDVEKILGQISVDSNIKQYPSLMIKYFTRTAINNTNISDLNLSLSKGIPVLARFEVKKDRKEHQLLIYEIIEKEDEYILGVYDPNFGAYSATNNLNHYRLNKKTELFTHPIYANEGTKIYIDSTSLRLSEFYKSIQRKDNIKQYIESSEKNGRFYYRPEAFLD